MALIEQEQKGKTRIIAFNRPDRRNAINGKLLQELTVVLQKLVKEVCAGQVKCVVITGRGEAFSTGGDFRDTSHKDITGRSLPDEVLRYDYNPLFLTLRNLDAPIITAVNGPAVGVAFAIALMGDVCYATESAYFQAIFSQVNLVSECGISYLLPRMVGYRRALDIALSGEKVSAQQAHAIGMVNQVFPDVELMMTKALEKAANMEAASGSINLVREVYRASYENCFEQQLELEAKLTQQAVSSLIQRKSSKPKANNEKALTSTAVE